MNVTDQRQLMQAWVIAVKSYGRDARDAAVDAPVADLKIRLTIVRYG